MPPRLARLSRQARAWFLREIAYVAERNPAAARKIIEQFQVARRNLAQFPGMAQTGLIPGTRRIVVGDYVLTVRESHGEAEIVVIRSGRQGEAYAPEHHADDFETH